MAALLALAPAGPVARAQPSESAQASPDAALAALDAVSPQDWSLVPGRDVAQRILSQSSLASIRAAAENDPRAMSVLAKPMTCPS